MKDKIICFVAMPIGSSKKEFSRWQEHGHDQPVSEYEHWKIIYDKIIVKAVNSSGLNIECVRADTDNAPGVITDELLRHLMDDYLAIFDVSGRNANVFYELGIRDCWHDRNIIITSDIQDIVFDIHSQRALVYKLNNTLQYDKFERELKSCLISILDEPDKLRNQVQKFLNYQADSAVKSAPPERTIKEVTVNALTNFQKRLDRLLRCMNAKNVESLSVLQRYNFTAFTAEERSDSLKPQRFSPKHGSARLTYSSSEILYLCHTISGGMPSSPDLKVASKDVLRLLEEQVWEALDFIIPINENINIEIKKSEEDKLWRFLGSPFYDVIREVLSGGPQRKMAGKYIYVEIWDISRIDQLEKEYDLV